MKIMGNPLIILVYSFSKSKIFNIDPKTENNFTGVALV